MTSPSRPQVVLQLVKGRVDSSGRATEAKIRARAAATAAFG
jgi:hypothetical protein